MRITLWKKAILLLGAVCLCFGFIVAYVARNADTIAEGLLDFRAIGGPRYVATLSLKYKFDHTVHRYEDLRHEYSDELLALCHGHRAEIDSLLIRLEELDGGAQAVTISVLESRIGAYFDAAERYTLDAVMAGPRPGPFGGPFDPAKAEHLDEVHGFIQERIGILLAEYLGQIGETMSVARDSVKVIRSRVIAAGVLFFCLVCPTILLIITRFIKPAQKLNLIAGQLVAGRDHHGIDPAWFPNDELGELARDLDAIAGELRRARTTDLYTNQVLESMSDMMVMFDEEGRISAMNRILCETLGYEESDLIGKPWSLIIPAANPGEFSQPDMQVDSLLGTREQQLRRVDGNMVATMLTANAVKGLFGGNVGYMCIARDVTDLRRRTLEKEMTAEVATLLIAADDKQRLAMEVAGVLSRRLGFDYSAIGMFGSGRRTVDLRGAVGIPLLPEKLKKVPVDQVSLRRLIDGREPVIEAPVAGGAERTWFGELEIAAQVAVPLRVDRNLIGVLLLGSSSPETLSDSTTSALRVIAQSVAQTLSRLEVEEMLAMNARVLQEKNRELEEAKTAAQKSDNAKSVFLAVISHEIRTPLNGIIGMTELLLKDDLTVPQREHMDMLRDSADGLLQIINDILDFSKIESSGVVLKPLPFDLRGLVEGIVEASAEPFIEKGIRLETVIEADTPNNLIGDPVRIRQILNNLVSNALKFTREGFVRIAIASEGMDGADYLIRIAVEDSGIGLSDEQIDLAFESFTQVDGSKSRAQRGVGLGLSVAKYLIELMGGKLDVISKEGQGSSFAFTLPLASAGGLSSSLPDGAADNRRANELDAVVLVVEDDEVNQRVAQEILSRMGCRVEVAGDGREAVRLMEEREYDIVVMDCMMPEMDGFEATAAIRAMDGPGSRVPIIALTANAMADDRKAVLEAGMDDYVSKPINPEFLRATIRRWLRAGQTLDAI